MSAILTRTSKDIIRKALQLIGEADAEQPLDATQFNDGLRDLNDMVKSWQSQGLHLWKKEEAILFLDVGKQDYLLGPTGDRCTLADDFIDTTLTADVTAGNNILPVEDTTGMANGDQVGIKLSDGSRQWTTITNVDSSTQLTITDNLIEDASNGATVFTFTNLIERPLRILQLRRFTVGADDEIEAIQWSRQEYFAQPDKGSQGQINNWYYSPQLGNGRVYIWQTADNVDRIAKFTYEDPIIITSTTADNPDFPSEWFNVLAYNLADEISLQYRVPPDRLSKIQFKAEDLLDRALGYDREPDSLNIQPDNRY